MDSRIIDFIHVRVSEGVRNVKEMKRHIKSYVKNDLFKDHTLPAPTNRRFYPSNVTVRNHIYLATVRLRFSKIDQVNLEKKIEEWKKECPSDSFYYRKYSDVKPDCDLHQQLSKLKDDAAVTDDVSIKLITSSNRLLFVYQTEWQKKLLSRYGNELSMLDATYKTTRYSLPLFFLVVKTNTDYQVVASFVVQDEIQESVAEALQMIHEWCPGWKPRYFMVDKSDAEINAITMIFPGM